MNIAVLFYGRLTNYDKHYNNYMKFFNNDDNKLFIFLSSDNEPEDKLKGFIELYKPISYTKEIEEYKIVPQGVRAMETWNKIVYDIHQRGTRSYLFLVNGIDYDKAPKDIITKYEQFKMDGNKFEYVGLPDEEDKLPNYFIPNIKDTLKFCFIDRYELLLKPLIQIQKKNEILTF